MSINDKHPKEWTDDNSTFAKQKIAENIKLIINLNKIRSYHLRNEITDTQEQAFVNNIKENFSDDAIIRIASKLLQNVSTKTKESIKND
jgi:hypothetical protein